MSDLARFDWRFLLAHPWPDEVGWTGLGSPGALASLARVLVLGQEREAVAQRFAVVVAHRATAAQVADAASRVEAGGSLVVEVPSSLGTGGIAAAVRRLRRLGFEDVRSHWHWPDLERGTRIVPLERRTIVLHALARSGGGLRARIQARFARVLLDLGLLSTVAGGTVVARRPPPGPRDLDSRSLVHRFLVERSQAAGIGPLAPFVALTPRFRNSSHLVFLIFREGEAEPALAVKLARRSGSSPALEAEAARLRAIQSIRDQGFDSIPRVVACDRFEGHALLAETAVVGRPMHPASVRADAEGVCAAVVGWLLELQKGSCRTRGAGDPWVVQRLERDLRTLEDAGLTDRVRIEQTRAAVQPLVALSVPAVLEHGDLSHPNILRARSGGPAVLDWEQAEMEGLPVVDLYFFLAYVARSLRQAMTGPPAAAAVADAFADPPAWLGRSLDRYADGLPLDRAARRPLWVACWVAQAAGLVRRLPAEVLNRANSRSEWERDWRFEMWRRALDEPDRFLRGA